MFYSLKGDIEAKGRFVNGRKNGIWKYYLTQKDTFDNQINYKNDTIITMTHYFDEKTEVVEFENGSWALATTYDNQQKITAKKTFKGSKTTEINYYDNAIKKRETVFESGNLVKEICYDSLGKVMECEHDTGRQEFQYVEQMPKPPYDIGTYIGNNYHYPKSAREQGKSGRVVVSFIVMEDGSIEGAYVAKCVWPALDDEALRVVKMMPKWKPGMQNGKAVKVKFSQPFNLKLE